MPILATSRGEKAEGWGNDVAMWGEIYSWKSGFEELFLNTLGRTRLKLVYLDVYSHEVLGPWVSVRITVVESKERSRHWDNKDRRDVGSARRGNSGCNLAAIIGKAGRGYQMWALILGNEVLFYEMRRRKGMVLHVHGDGHGWQT